jgi:hypothetical protein
MNKKIVSIVFIVLALLSIGMLAVPLVLVMIWKSDTTTSITETLTEANAESEKSLTFLSMANLTAKDYDDAITSLEQTKGLYVKAKANLGELGLNTIDVTGEYAKTQELREKLDSSIETIIDNYSQQILLVEEEKKAGASVESAGKLAEVAEKNSNNFDDLSALVAQL